MSEAILVNLWWPPGERFTNQMSIFAFRVRERRTGPSGSAGAYADADIHRGKESRKATDLESWHM